MRPWLTSLCGLLLLLCACDCDPGMDASPCSRGDECASGVCGLATAPQGTGCGDSQRHCLPEADLIYVRHGGTCGLGTLADPACDYPFGKERATVRLLPGRDAPGRLTVRRGGTQWTVYADGIVAALPTVLLTTDGEPTRLTLVGGRALGVRCVGSLTQPGVALTLEGVEVTWSSDLGVGVDATDCEVRIHGALVHYNRGGIRLYGGAYEITTSTIQDNASTMDPGVFLGGSARPIGDDRAAFRENLVQRNQTQAGVFVGGVDCDWRSRALGPTALCDNSTWRGVQSNCTFAEQIPCPKE